MGSGSVRDLSADSAYSSTTVPAFQQRDPLEHISEGNEQSELHRQSSTVNNDGDPLIFTLCASDPEPFVDLSMMLAKRLAAYAFPHLIVRFMCRNFPVLAMLFRVAMACFVGLLFLPRGTGRYVLSITMPLLTPSVITTMLLLATDICLLLTRHYEFWFLTAMNTLNWMVMATIMKDIRVLGCFAAWLAYQSVILVDANHRTYATTLSSAMASTPILIGVAACVSMQSISDGDFFEIHLSDRKIGDASDLVTFTTSTLALFFIRLLIAKKKRGQRVVRGCTSIPCATLKTTLRLVPLNETKPAVRAIPQNESRWGLTPRQQLITSRLPLTRVDARRTLLPYHIWRNPPLWVKHNASQLRALCYAVGVLAYASLTFATFRRFYALWARSTAMIKSEAATLKPPSLTDFLGFDYWVTLAFASAGTTIFCGGFVLFYQRDLLRTLVWNFDFVFTAIQPIIFHACLCDANYWESELIVMVVLWDIWFFWCLSLDALTPLVKFRVFRFKKRFAAPVLASVVVGSAMVSFFVLFIPDLGFRDRVVWSYRLPSGAVFSIRSLAVLIGRSVTIVMWSSRQAYLLFIRKDDELNLIRGGVEYLSPFPLISSKMSRTFVSTRNIDASPLLPAPAREDPSPK